MPTNNQPTNKRVRLDPAAQITPAAVNAKESTQKKLSSPTETAIEYIRSHVASLHTEIAQILLELSLKFSRSSIHSHTWSLIDRL